MERYSHRFDIATGGGVETASVYLASALGHEGVEIDWYTASEHESLRDFVLRAAGCTAVLPLTDSVLFRRAAGLECESIRRRLLRIWHDVSLLAPPVMPIPSCPVHGGAGQSRLPCIARGVASDTYAADVFFRNEGWTHCFPRRQYIPWAVDHLPALDLRASEGPILLLAGKTSLRATATIVEACTEHAVPIRIIFSNWNLYGRKVQDYFSRSHPPKDCEIIGSYNIGQDFARVFAGVSAAFVLSRYHETFSFVAAEAVHFGIPVITLSCSGAACCFAARVVGSEEEAAGLVRTGYYRDLLPLPRSRWRWRDVAAAYLDLLDSIDNEGCSSLAVAELRTAR